MNTPRQAASPPPAPAFASAWRAQVGAEIKNRLRSPASLVAFLVILIGSYWAIPPADGKASSVTWHLADGRMQAPLFTAGYLGVAISVLATIFFMLAAFYLVAGSVKRDRERGIGLILAATPLTKTSYLGAKWAAHALFLFLLSLLVLPVGLFHFLRSGVGSFDAAQFFGPFLLAALPAAAFIAAAAVLFDVTPLLRSRGGLVLWFLVGVIPMTAIPMETSRDPLDRHRLGHVPAFDPLGMVSHESLIQASLPPEATGISSGYVFHDVAPERVAWPGLTFPPGTLRQRGLNLLWALLPLAAAVLIFDRFDPARRAGRAPKRRSENGVPREPAQAPAPRTLASLAPVHPRTRVRQAVWAETRLLWESAHWVKWLVPPAAIVAALLPASAAPMASAVFLLLLVPIVSEVGCRERLAGAGPLVFSQPAIPGSVALWKFAAVALFLLAASLPLTLRGVATGGMRAIAVPLGMLFVAAFAVGAAALTGGGKLFSGVFLLLWYLALNRLGAVDFCALLAPEATWAPRLWFSVAGALWLAGAIGWERRRAA